MNDNQKFREWLEGVPYREHREKRMMIAKRCGVTPGAVSHWVTGKNKIPTLCKREIEQIAKCKIFN